MFMPKGFGDQSLGSTSASGWSAAGTLQRSSIPFTGTRQKHVHQTAVDQSQTTQRPNGDEETLKRRAELAKDWAELHNSERFVHPRSGRELPEVVHFRPGRCELLDGGRATSQIRGLLHYLATGGSEDFVNAGDAIAQIEALRVKVEHLASLVRDEREKAYEMESMLLLMQLQDSRSAQGMMELVKSAREHLENCCELEDQLEAEQTLWEPNQPRVDEMRRAIHTLSSLVDAESEDAEKLDVLLRHQGILRAGLAAKRKRVKEAGEQMQSLQLSIHFLQRHGFVQVRSSGWQRGRHEDVLSLTPRFSWSNYTWESRSSPDHPLQYPAGAWFTVALPAGVWIIPTHYALRHGDDCVPHAPGVRHDSNASMWEGTLHKTVAPATEPVTSWGSTTRALREYSPNALMDWQLWGREGGEESRWILLRDHRGDTALHSAFGEAVWRVRCDDEERMEARDKRKFVLFMVIMTGPTANGGHGLFCSGFEVFGQVGIEKEPKPPPEPPHGLRYKFDNELYLCDGLPIVRNPCTVLGTNDKDCPMTFTADPPLPPGLLVDPGTGDISGRLELESLGRWQIKVLRGERLGFTVTCANCVGEARTRVTLTIITAPRHFGYKHTDVTYEVGDGHMAFSAELLAKAEEEGWKRHPFLPVDITRDMETNGVCEEGDFGSRFAWPDSVPRPTVGGRQVTWAGRLAWPKFELMEALPEGLELDERTAMISGVPTREESGTYTVRCVNPAGAVTTTVHISVMVPPQGLEYEKAEAVLVYMQDIGIKTCRCEQGTQPLRFQAPKLPRGLVLNPHDGSIVGVASQLDQSFIKYTVRVANDVGMTETEIKLLCAMPMDQISEAERIVNLNVEARVGQKVRGTTNFISSRSVTGLPDPSATVPRHPNDRRRYRALEAKTRQLGWSDAPGSMHVAAAGRGTITQVMADGNACQVRWDNTGLTQMYRTGKDAEYELQLWGTSRRLVEAWEALESEVQARLSADDDELERHVEGFLAEHRAGGRWQQRELTKIGMFDRELRTWLQSTAPLPFGYKGRALLQRIVLELSDETKQGAEGEAESDAGFNPASRFSRELWNCMHIQDARVGLAIDWDPYIAFMEFVQHSRAVTAAPTSRQVNAAAASRAFESRTPKLRGKKKETGQAGPWALTAGERKCVLTWLLVDKKLRLALQDSVGEGWTAEAAVQLVRTETRRMGRMEFVRGMREMSAGLHLGLSENSIQLVFKQADSDKDGYVTLPDAVKAFREARRLTRWQKQRRQETSASGGAAAACQQAGLNITWSDLVELVHSRPVSLTLQPAAGIHDVIEAKIYAAMAPVERRGKQTLSRVVERNRGVTHVGNVGTMRQWADFGGGDDPVAPDLGEGLSQHFDMGSDDVLLA